MRLIGRSHHTANCSLFTHCFSYSTHVQMRVLITLLFHILLHFINEIILFIQRRFYKHTVHTFSAIQCFLYCLMLIKFLCSARMYLLIMMRLLVTYIVNCYLKFTQTQLIKFHLFTEKYRSSSGVERPQGLGAPEGRDSNFSFDM